MALLGSVPVIGALVRGYADTCTGTVSGVHTAHKRGLRGGRSMWGAIYVSSVAAPLGAPDHWGMTGGYSYWPKKAERDAYVASHAGWRACE